MLVGFVEEASGHRFYNAAVFFSNGEPVHVHRKVYLPTYGMFDEGRDFAVRRSAAQPSTRHFGPVEVVLVCEDRVASRADSVAAGPGRRRGAVHSFPAVRPAEPGPGTQRDQRRRLWQRLLRQGQRRSSRPRYIVYVNRVGCEDGLIFGGGSVAVDPFGRTIAALPALDAETTVVELDAEVLRRARTAYPLLRDDDLDLVHRELGRLRAERYGLPEETLEESSRGRRRAEP